MTGVLTCNFPGAFFLSRLSVALSFAFGFTNSAMFNIDFWAAFSGLSSWNDSTLALLLAFN